MEQQPRQWQSIEELDWSEKQLQEKRDEEFSEKPIDWLNKIKDDTTGFARREFLTVMGASMAMASLSCARRPVHKIIPYVIKPEEITPGVATYYASTSKECPCRCGLLVKTREGRPIKLEGNPDHPLNRGALCTQAQASVLSLYDTDRLRGPRTGARTGSPHDISWKDADAQITAVLRNRKGRVRVLTPELRGHSTPKVIRDFLASFSNGKHVEYEPIGLEEISTGQEKSYGTAVTPRYHFDKAETVVSIGADFLGSWLSPVRHSGDFTKNRKLGAGTGTRHSKLTKLIVFETTMTITGASADERYAIRPGDEHKIAMAIAHEIHKSGGGGEAVLDSYKPETVAADVGLPSAEPIKRAAEELMKNKGAGLVVAGGIASNAGNQIFTQIAANYLNSTLGNEGKTVDGGGGAPLAGQSGLESLLAEMNSGQVDVLIIYRCNPAYDFALGDFATAANKVPLVVAISDREDETAKLANFVLPDHHYLENWGDSQPEPELFSVQQPTIAPLHDTRAFEDSLLAWQGGKGSWHDYLKNHWRETLYKQSGGVASFDDFWESCLRKGALDARGGRSASARSFKAGALGGVPAFKAGASGDLVLALYPTLSIHDGRHANNAWLQEMPDPISSATWDNYLNVAPALAEKLALRNDHVVELNVGGKTVRLPVHVQPGMHPGVVSTAVGYGRQAAGKVGNECGKNVYPLVTKAANAALFSGQAATLRRTEEIYRLAKTQWYMDARGGNAEPRPIINEVSLAEFRKDPGASQETNPELRLETVPTMWPKHKYTGHRWGMAIDLNGCTSCGACTIACQAENNIPVVGREQVRNNRHMGWIRIDRYFSGSPENPNVAFQPMLCQHCENAPCETVCPVIATLHDDEGLNVQVYNRCVGTRYCQNNCPYKVRRFNFFDHWIHYEGTMNLAWNPDVTVRTRGIMEKCTFCVQRIREAKDKAKDMNIAVADGSFKTACQQTCPNDAIVFGDLNDPTSRVSRLRADPRNYRVLENNNTMPAVSYLTKVRNAEGGEAHG
jgi:molybdopterin-containing oxidoreductase family iron-sulfur binding subunit